MLDFDKNFTELSIDELDNWLKAAYQQRADYLDNDNISDANSLDMLIDVVKQIKNRKINEEPTAIGESLTTYSTKKKINEHTETGKTCLLFEVYENLRMLKESLPDLDVDTEVTGTVENGYLVSLDPIVVDIAFELKYLDEAEQHITLTYTTADNIHINLAGIPRADYSTMEMGGETIISFKSLLHLGDECEAEFTETIEWPFEIKFKSVTAAKKYNNALTNAERITLLLGKEKLINKVEDYKSTHQRGSNQATRAAAKAAAEEQEIRNHVIATAGKTKSQILKELIEDIDGIGPVTVSDLNNPVYYKKFSFRILANNAPYEILMARTLSPEEMAQGKKAFICRMLNDQERALQCNNRDQVITWLENKVASLNAAAHTANLTPRERAELRARAAQRRL